MQWLALHNLWLISIIPAIVLLYLLKRKYEERTVSSVLLWQQMLQNREVSRPLQRLRRNLLLFLQLLVALFLLLALLKPAIPSEGMIAQHTVVVLDSSGSMMALEGGQSRLQKAKQEIATLIEKLRNGQAITLIEAGRVPRVLLSHSSDQAALLDRLNDIRPRFGTTDVRAALSLARAIASSAPGSGVMWYGDGGPSMLPVKELSGFTPASFRFVQTGSSKENVTIGAFATQQGTDGWQGLLRVDNLGAQKQQGNVMIYDAAGTLLAVKPLQVASQESQTFTFDALPASPAYEAVIEVENDRLPADNRQWSVPVASGKARVILVSKEGNVFLHEVLKLSRVQVETMTQVPDKIEQPPDLWIFDRVVPEQLPPGNLLLIGPNRATSWLPYQGEDTVAGPLEVQDDKHPIMRYADFQDVHLSATARLGAINGMNSLLQTGKNPVILAGNIQDRRSVILGFDLHQSDLPLRPAFPIFMQNVLAWLTPVQSTSLESGYPGETLGIPLTPGAMQRFVQLPDGQKLEIGATGTMALFQVPEQVGLYRLEEWVDGKKLERLFQIRMPEEETSIVPYPMQVLAGQEETAKEQSAGNDVRGIYSYQDFTDWLMLIALLILFVEWKVYQRGY